MKQVSDKRIEWDATAANQLIMRRSCEISEALGRAQTCGVNKYTLVKMVLLSISALITLVIAIIGILNFNTASYTSTGLSIALLSVSFYGFFRFLGADYIEMCKLGDYRTYKEAVLLQKKLTTQTTYNMAEFFKESIDGNGNFSNYDLGYDFGTATSDCLADLRRIESYDTFKMKFDVVYWICSIALTIGAILVTTDMVYNSFQSGIAKDLSIVFVLTVVSIITLIGYSVANFFASKAETHLPTMMLAGDVGIGALSGVALYIVVGIIFVLIQIFIYIIGIIILCAIIGAIFSS